MFLHRACLAAGVAMLATALRADAQGCDVRGYLLAVEAPALADADTAFLQATARALAYRWPVPSRRRDTYVSWRRVRRRTLPPEPRWADDWTPPDRLRGAFRVTLLRRGRPRVEETKVISGDELFDRSLRLMFTDPLPASPDLPPFPASVTADSLVVIVHLGELPDSVRAGGIRFAVKQRPVELVPGSLEFTAPRTQTTPPSAQRFATIKYDVNEYGAVVPSTLEVLDSSDRALVDAIRDALPRARFRAAEQGCRPVTITVVQTFRG